MGQTQKTGAFVNHPNSPHALPRIGESDFDGSLRENKNSFSLKLGQKTSLALAWPSRRISFTWHEFSRKWMDPMKPDSNK